MTPMTTDFGKLLLLFSRFFVPALLVGILLLSACSKSPAQIEKKDMGLGQHYLSEGKLNEAIIEFQNVLKINQKSINGRIGLATAYLKKGWLAQSILEFQEIAKESPLNIEAHIELARYGVNSGQWNAVEKEIATILKIDPKNVDGLTFEGERMLALDNNKKALIEFKQALSLSPGFIPALVGMGNLLRHQNHLKQAKSFYDRALSLDKNNSSALSGLGSLALKEGNFDEAKAYLIKAMELDKTNLRSRIIYANFLAGRGHPDQAAALLKSVPAKEADLRVPIKLAEYDLMAGNASSAIQILHPLELQKIEIPDIYFVLVKAYQATGQNQEALDMVNKLITMSDVPPLIMVSAARTELALGNWHTAKNILNSLKSSSRLPIGYWETLGQVEELQNHPSKAIKIFKEGLLAYPNNGGLLLSLADSLVLNKNDKEAKNILNALLKKDPKNPAVIGQIGNLEKRKKGVSAQIAYYRNAAKKYPDVSGIEFLYLLSLATSNHQNEAITEARNYLESHPGNQNVRFLLAQIELQVGRRDQAIALYKIILSDDPKNLQALHALADQELANQQYAEAESYYRRSLSVQPDNSLFYVGLGEALLGEKQDEAAITSFKKALSINPNEPIALLQVSKSEILAGESQQALAHLNPLLRVNFPPKQKALIQWLWGVAAENNRDFQTAIKSFKNAIQLDPKNAAYYASLGDLYANLSQWDQALLELNKSLAFDQSLSLVRITRDWVSINQTQQTHNREKLQKLVSEASEYQKSHFGDLDSGLIEARADLLLKDFSAALAVFDQILSKHPKNPTILLGKAETLLFQDHPKKAQSLINKILIDHPNDVKANLQMASLDGKVGNLRGEVDHLEKVHQAYPDWVQPSLALIEADIQLGRFEEAKSIAFAIHEGHPELTGSLLLLGNAEMGLKEYRGALMDYGRLLKYSNKPGVIHNMMSVAALKLGDKDEARHYLDLALKEAPKDPIVLNNMAFFLADNTMDLSKALYYAKQAVKITPQPFIKDTLGFIFYKMGNYSKAQVYFKSAYDSNFRDAEFLYHMGLNEWKLGDHEQASNHLKQAVASGSLTPNEQEKAQEKLRNH